MRQVGRFLGVVAVLLASTGVGATAARAQQTGGQRTTTTTEEVEYRTTTTQPRPSTTTTTGRPTTTTTPGDAPDPTVPSSGGGGSGPDSGSGGGTSGGGSTGGSGSGAGSGSSGGGTSGGSGTSGGGSGSSGGGTGSGGPSAPPPGRLVNPDDPSSSGGGGDGPETGANRVVPQGYQAMINSVKRSRANSSSALLAALRSLEDLGVPAAKIPLIGMGRFPVAGPASFVDDWWYPRYTPTFHLHQGTDIFGPYGTPVLSPVDGTIRHTNGAVGGLSVYVTQPDGTYFYLTHLSGYAKQPEGATVKTGEVVGYLGNSGNAQGTPPHVHFEIHPRGGGATNPKPFLDRWLSDAMANVPKLIAAFEGDRPRAVVTTGLTRRMSGDRSGVFNAPSAPPRSQLLWASSASPSGGVLRLAEVELSEASRNVNWAELARDDIDRRAAWQEADQRAQIILGPLTPAGLASFLQLPGPSTVISTTLIAARAPAGRPQR